MLKQVGRLNISAGLAVMAAFMAYGFLLIYLRDFAPGKADWIATYSTGKHFESRLAHVHGNLFALLNILFGYLILKLPVTGQMAKWSSWLALGGLLMPLGILGEVYLGLSPVFVFAGAVSMISAVIVLSVAVARQSGAEAA
jgi:hypothetical protein